MKTILISKIKPRESVVFLLYNCSRSDFQAEDGEFAGGEERGEAEAFKEGDCGGVGALDNDVDAVDTLSAQAGDCRVN